LKIEFYANIIVEKKAIIESRLCPSAQLTISISAVIVEKNLVGILVVMLLLFYLHLGIYTTHHMVII